jgi:hypothetical protein
MFRNERVTWPNKAAPWLRKFVAGGLPLRALFEPRLVCVWFVVDDVLLLLVNHTFLTVLQVFVDEQFNPVHILTACVSDKVNIYFWLILHTWVIFSFQILMETLFFSVIILICDLVSYARVPNSYCSQYQLCHKHVSYSYSVWIKKINITLIWDVVWCESCRHQPSRNAPHPSKQSS